MGCFNVTCCVSGLPINHNDSVYVILLERKTGYPDNSKYFSCQCKSTDFFVPITFPIKGTYDNYGSVENCEPKWFHNELLNAINKGLTSDHANFMVDKTIVSDLSEEKFEKIKSFKDFDHFFKILVSSLIKFNNNYLGYAFIREDAYNTYCELAEKWHPKWFSLIEEGYIACKEALQANSDFARMRDWGASNEFSRSLNGNDVLSNQFYISTYLKYNNPSEQDFEEFHKAALEFIKLNNVMHFTCQYWISRRSHGQNDDLNYAEDFANTQLKLIEKEKQKRIDERD
jgi:hypothetical protein